MAKRLFLLHLGPDPVDVSSMTEALARGRVAVPGPDAQAFTHAQVDILRSHRAAGLRRKDVEGAWARLCRRAHKARSDCFLSMPAWFAASPGQAALALDGLAGFRVVLVVTSGFAGSPAAWTSLVHAERIHVLPAHLSDEQLAAQVARIALIEQEARLERRLDRRLARASRRRAHVDRGLAA